MAKVREKLKMHVFKSLPDIPDNDARIDGNMVKILGLLDGHKSLASVAFASGMSMTDFQKAVKTLIEMDLIVPTDTGEKITG